MANSVDIVVNVLTKVKDSGVADAETKFGKFGSTMKKAMVPAIAAAGAVAAFGVAAVKSASRLEQAMGGVDAVFGKNAGTVKKWAEDAAGSIGLAKSEYGELATLIGSQLKNAGLPMDAVAKKTKGLIDMGADLAAMYGGTTAEAVEALSSALKGEFDPMEKYGASLSAAKISAEMAAKGTDKLTGKAYDQAKAMATLSLMTKQTADAEGAAAREKDSVAAKTQQATAQFENMKATLGAALLPTISTLMGYLAKAAVWMEKNATVVQILAGVILALAAAVVVVNVAMLILAANPVVLTIAAIVAAVIALGIALTVAYKKSETFRAIVDTAFAVVSAAAQAAWKVIKVVWDAIWTAAKTVFNWIRDNWKLIAAILTGPFGIAVALIIKYWANIKAAALAVYNWLKTTFVTVWGIIKAAAVGPFNALTAIIRTVKDAAQAVWQYLKGPLTTVWNAVGSAAERGLRPIKTVMDQINSAIGWVIGKVHDLISALSNIKVPDINLPGPLGSLLSAPSPAVAGRSAAVGAMAAPRVRAGRRSASSGGGGTTINLTVNGAIDPEGTARQIRRILSGHELRMGGAF